MDGIESIGSSISPSSVLLEEVESSVVSTPTLEDLEDVLAASDAEKHKLAKDFESILLTRFFDEIRKSIGTCGFEEDPAGQQIHGMFWSYLAQDVADKGGFGLSDQIYRYFQDMNSAQTVGAQIDKEL